MKNIRTLVALFVLAAFLAGTAFATTSSINPNVPAQNSPLSSSVLRGNFGAGYNDENTIYGILTLSSNQLLGTVNAGMANGLNVPSCASGALSWTPGTGFGCNSLSGLISPITQSLIFTGVNSFNLNAVTLPTKQVGTVLQVGNADTLASRLENDAFGGAAYFTGVRSDGTNAAPTTLQSGDEIAGFNAWGYNGSSIVGPRASMRAFAAQNWTGSAQGTYVDVSTSLNGTTTMTAVCRFENDGGMTCPSTVTGGSQGAGRINAAGLVVNGVAVSTGNSSLSALTAATATNAIENGANAQVWNFDGLTTQTALQITGTGVTSGQLVNSSVANAGSTGYAGYFSNIGTGTSYGLYSTDASTGSGYGHYSSITGASNSGYGLYGLNSGASNTGYGVYGSNASTTGYAVYSAGTLGVGGALKITATTASAPTTGMYSSAAGTLDLTATGGVSALHVTSTGSIGIGTTTPGNLLEIKGVDSFINFNATGGIGHFGGFRFQSNGSDRYTVGLSVDPSNLSLSFSRFNSSGVFQDNPLTLTSTGTVVIADFGGATATAVCQNAGILSTCSSSARYKENIKDAAYGLSDVMKMRPVTFDWKARAADDPTRHDFGMIAEEVEKIDPLFVNYKDGVVEGIKYTPFDALLVKAIQQQQNELASIAPGIFPMHKCFFGLLICAD